MKVPVLFFASFFLLPALFFGVDFSTEVQKASEQASKNGLRVYEISRKTQDLGASRFITAEFLFENTTERTLESEFEFPLSDGEAVVGYALDVNGKMRRGVVVEKDKGRKVFEEIVRRGVDPGLVEQTVGNNFKTRVYPITPHGVRHLEITVQKEIVGNEAKKSAGKIQTETIGKETFFHYYNEIPEFEHTREKSLPKSLVVWWDISSSAKDRDIKAEISLLVRYVKKAAATRVTVVPFCNELHEAHVFGAGGNDIAALESFLLSQQYDGATFISYDFSSFGGDEVLVFSDGIENWFSPTTKNAQKQNAVSVNVISSSRSADFSRLKEIAQAGNGSFINVTELGEDSALSMLEKESFGIGTIDFDAKAIRDVCVSVNPYGLSISGVLLRKTGSLKIPVYVGAKTVRTIEIDVSSVNSEDLPFVSLLWAQKKIDSLSSRFDENRTEIIALAKKFGVVTKGTSLIVLENVSDYVKYEIEPPEELRSEYDRLISRQSGAKNTRVSGIPLAVYRKFEEFREWWKKTPFDWEKTKKEKEAASRREELRGRVVQESNEMAMEAQSPMLMESVSVDAAMEAVPLARTAAAAPRMAGGSAKSAGSTNANSAESENRAKISLRAWDSASPYLAALKKSPSEKMYAEYIALKAEWGASPAFYMEVSDYFLEEGFEWESRRILSNLSELNLENTDVLRALGYKLFERGEYYFAMCVFEKLTSLRTEIPQFHRDLAFAAFYSGNAQKSVDHLWHIASQSWDARYEEIQQTALNDMNSMIARSSGVDTSKIDKKLMENFDCDIRVVLTWNTDDCDIDLWVTDPLGEKCFYGHKLTAQGGRMSRDFTQGYGPEEFALRNAEKGVYKIEANYFGTRKQSVLQPVTVQAEVYTNFGRPNEKREVLTLQLKDVRGTFLVGEVEF